MSLQREFHPTKRSPPMRARQRTRGTWRFNAHRSRSCRPSHHPLPLSQDPRAPRGVSSGSRNNRQGPGRPGQAEGRRPHSRCRWAGSGASRWLTTSDDGCQLSPSQRCRCFPSWVRVGAIGTRSYAQRPHPSHQPGPRPRVGLGWAASGQRCVGARGKGPPHLASDEPRWV